MAYERERSEADGDVRDEVEVEPTDLDEPAGGYAAAEAFDDDEDGEGLDIQAEEEGDEEDDEEPASPLAEDAPIRRLRVRTSGSADIAAMSQRDRRREFPSVPGRKVAGSRRVKKTLARS